MNNPSVTIIPNGFQESYCVDLLNSLIENNVKVDFISSDYYDGEKIDKRVVNLNLRGSQIEDVSFIKKAIRVPLYYYRFCKYVVKSPKKIFHVIYLRFNFFDGVIFNFFLKLLGKRVIYTAHNVLPHNKENFLNRIIFSIVYSIADVIVVHTEYLQHRLMKEFKIVGRKIRVVKHGVYKSRNNPLINTEKAREYLGMSQDAFVLLFFGGILPYKGLPILLDALAGSRTIQGIKLIIAGKIEKKYENFINSYIEKLGLDDNIVRKFYFLSDDEIEMIFKASNVVILPYLEGSQSGVLFMSYSYGRPVIVSDVGNFSNDVINGKTGYIFKKGSSVDLAEKIRLSINELLKIGNNCEGVIKEYANSNYSWEKAGFDFKEIYSQWG